MEYILGMIFVFFLFYRKMPFCPRWIYPALAVLICVGTFLYCVVINITVLAVIGFGMGLFFLLFLGFRKTTALSIVFMALFFIFSESPEYIGGLFLGVLCPFIPLFLGLYKLGLYIMTPLISHSNSGGVQWLLMKIPVVVAIAGTAKTCNGLLYMVSVAVKNLLERKG